MSDHNPPQTSRLSRTVAVLGASPNPERYSNMAVLLLKEMGHSVLPIHPAAAEIAGLPAVASLSAINRSVHTLTIYIASLRLPPIANEILQLKPERVIFNPGTENGDVAAILRSVGIECLDACTLVLLRTGQF